MVKGMLLRKSIRDMKKSKSQFISIFIMAALAVSLVTGLDSMWKTIEDKAVAMYSATNLSDLWVNIVNPTEKQLWSVKRVSGVQSVERRYSIAAIADLNGSPTLQVYTTSERNTLDVPKILQGGFVSTGGAVLDETFAKKHGIKIGDEVSIEINDKWLKFPIEGLALSSEHIFSVKGSTSMLPNPEKYGFIIINEEILKSAYGQKVYNQICVRLTPSGDMSHVKKEIGEAIGDDLIGLVARNDNKSVNNVNAQIQQFKTLAIAFPLMFFLVTALITQSTMVRLVENQRSQIGVLKALGYTKVDILWHYTSYGVYIGILAAVAGVIFGPNVFGGILVPRLPLTLSDYRIAINFENFIYSTILILVCTGGVSFYACLKLQRDTPATLLRDKPPKEGSHIFLEYFKNLWHNMKFSSKLIARNTLKNKSRLVMSIIGITGCAGLIVAAFTISNMIEGISDQIYGKTFTYDQKIFLKAKADTHYIHNEKLDGITQEIQEQAIETIAPNGIRKMELLTILPQKSPLIHLKDVYGNTVKLPLSGVTMTRKLAEIFKIKAGDSIKIKLIDDSYISVPVTQIIYIVSGQGMYMTDEYWESLGENFKPTAVLVKWNQKPDADFLAGEYVKEYVDMKTQKDDMKSSSKILNIAVVMLVIMAAMLAFVVLYNSSILNFVERIRDLATFRVLGFHHNEIRALVLMENILCVIVGSILGILVGKAIAEVVARGLNDQMDLISHISFGTVVIAGTITFIFALVINSVVAKKMKTIDMLQALKSVE